MHAADRILAQVDDRRKHRPLRRRPCWSSLRKRAIAAPHRLEPGLDIEIAGAIDAAGGLVGILETGDGNVRCRRQIGFTITRAEIEPAPIALPSSGTLATDSSLGRRHAVDRLALLGRPRR